MRTAEFYSMEPEKQNYVRDVLVSIATAGAPFDDYVTALNNAKIFPRQTAMSEGAGNVAVNIGSQTSPASQTQVAQQQAASASRYGSIGAAEHKITNRNEALIGSRRGGPA